MTGTEFERIMFQALKENANESSEKLLEGFDEKRIHIFSERFNRRMYRDIKRYGINPRGIIKIKHNIFYNKAFVSAASVILILTGTSLAVPEVRAIVWGAVIEWIENQINIYFHNLLIFY